MKRVEPEVFVVAETNCDVAGMRASLQGLGMQNEWKTDAAGAAEHLTEYAGKLCYLSFDTELNENLTRVGMRDNLEYIQQGLIMNEHGSVLEHATVSVLFCNVSRILTHELVRHRAGVAYSQTSGRYVRAYPVAAWVPPCIAENSELLAIYERAFQQMEENVRAMERLVDIDKLPFAEKKKYTSAFRRVIGGGQATHVLVTANHRAWRHIMEIRTAPGAEEEMRHVFVKVAKLMRERYSAIYHDMVIDEDQSGCSVKFARKKV